MTLPAPAPAAVAPPPGPGATPTPAAGRVGRPFSRVELLGYEAAVLTLELGAYAVALTLGLLAAAAAGAHLGIGRFGATGVGGAVLLVARILIGVAAGTIGLIEALVLARTLLARGIRPGRFLLTSPRLWPWTCAVALHMIFHRSPIANLVHGHLVLRQLYYRGMGLRLPPSTYLAQNVILADPWLTRIGPGTVLGDGAVVSAHKMDRDVVTLARVDIGRHVLIGARAHIQPGVRIDDHAVIAANALVVRGTHVRAGETWIGNPAAPLQLQRLPVGAGGTAWPVRT